MIGWTAVAFTSRKTRGSSSQRLLFWAGWHPEDAENRENKQTNRARDTRS